jgi:hypothetical protein
LASLRVRGLSRVPYNKKGREKRAKSSMYKGVIGDFLYAGMASSVEMLDSVAFIASKAAIDYAEEIEHILSDRTERKEPVKFESRSYKRNLCAGLICIILSATISMPFSRTLSLKTLHRNSAKIT